MVSRPDGNSADVCEGEGIGSNRNFNRVDEDPEVRTGAVSASCAPGDYTVEVSVSSPGNVELASAAADFTVNAPGQQQQPEPPSTDATLSNLALSGVYFGTFYPATTGYNASVGNGVDETTVTPTVNHDGATYAIKLGGVTDADGVIPLAVGSKRHHRRDHRRGRQHRQDLHRNRHPGRAAALHRRYAERSDPERCHPGVRISHDRVHRQRRQRRDAKPQ